MSAGSLNGSSLSLASLTVGGNVINGGPAVSQTLSVNSNNLSISGGNTVALPQQTLSLVGDSLSISSGNSVSLPQQTLSLVGDSLSISSGNSVSLPQQTLSLVNNNMSISGGNTVAIPQITNISFQTGGIPYTKIDGVLVADGNTTFNQSVGVNSGLSVTGDITAANLRSTTTLNLNCVGELNMNATSGGVAITTPNSIFLNYGSILELSGANSKVPTTGLPPPRLLIPILVNNDVYSLALY